MGKCNTGKDSKIKQKVNNREMSHTTQGNVKEQDAINHSNSKWKGKDGYHWTQTGKINAQQHPKLSNFQKNGHVENVEVIKKLL